MNDDGIQIPEFLTSRAYEERRQQRMAEERARAEFERRRRYRLYREQQIKRTKELRKRVVKKFVKLLVCGTLIIVCGTGIINNILKQSGNETSQIKIVEIIEMPEMTIHVENDFVVEGNVVSTTPIPTITPREYDFSLENRLASINESTTFAVGSEINTYSLNLMTRSPAYQHFIKYGDMYGIDPYLLMAIAVQESSFQHSSCLPGGANYNGHGVGIMQLETPNNREFKAYNYHTGQTDTMRVTNGNAINLENNIRLGAMYFQYCLEKNNGNILLAIQSYNYGHGMVDVAVSTYAIQMGITSEEVRNNHSDTGWLSIIRDIHENPKNYASNWRYKTYGDANYIKNVLRYFVGESTYYYYNGKLNVFNLHSLENELLNTEINRIIK